jgi:hypothetical protein
MRPRTSVKATVGLSETRGSKVEDAMDFNDHDLVVEDNGLLFRACISGSALNTLWRPTMGAIEAEVLIADNRPWLEEVAIRKHRTGLVGCAGRVTITATDVDDWMKMEPAQR